MDYFMQKCRWTSANFQKKNEYCHFAKLRSAHIRPRPKWHRNETRQMQLVISKCSRPMFHIKLGILHFALVPFRPSWCCATVDCDERKPRVTQLNYVHIMYVCRWSHFDRDKDVRAILFTLQCPAKRFQIEIIISMGKYRWNWMISDLLS